MIKTKCILQKPDKDDGIRICVMRWVKPFYSFDMWLKDLAPSIGLLNSYKSVSIKWAEFEQLYKEDMKSMGAILNRLRMSSERGEVLTLLCVEKTADFCHRRILKQLIEEAGD